MSDVALLVNGKAYAGWKRARVTRSIESISGSFELEVSDRWGEGKPWPILEEDECTVKLGARGETVLTGFVDRRAVSYDADGHTLAVSGRDAAGALVDCSALLDKWEFKGIPLLTMVKRVCDPFGIAVRLQAGLTPANLPAPPKKLSIDPGDTAHDVIEKVCRMAGVLAVSDGRGGIVLTRTGTERVGSLVEGENILSASSEFDASGRFHDYAVLGQHHGTDEFSGAKAAQVKGVASDENVTRVARTLVIRPESSVTKEQAKIRAQWEAKVRAARGDSVSVTVQGWTRAASGFVWPVNALVNVRSPTIGVHGDMLITQLTFNAGESGTTTEITLKRPDAFLIEPVIRQATGGNNYWKEIARGV